MSLGKLAATASLALVAEAFMIPSTITLPGVEIDGEGDFHALRMPDELPEQLKNIHLGFSKPLPSPETTRVVLDCNDCSFTPGSASETLDSSVNNSLVLDFNLSDDRETLELNGQPFFPLQSQTGKITAFQTVDRDAIAGEEEESDAPSHRVLVHSGERTLDFTAGARSVEAADGTDAQLIDLFFSVFGLDDESVSLDNVDIRMLQDEAGKLHLVHLVTSPSNGKPQNGHTKETEVHNPLPPSDEPCPPAGIAAVLCRMSKQIKAKVEDWHLIQPNNHPHRKPCAGRLAQLFGGVSPSRPGEEDFRPPPIKGGPAKFMSRPQFQAHEGHHPFLRHHEHTWMHTAATFLRGLVFGFVIPIIVGVVAGMTASLVGMAVGTLIAWLWVKLVRGGKRGNATARQDARAARCEEEVHIGEKDDLMLEHAPALEDQEDPPVYVEKE